MIGHLALVLICQLTGEVISRQLGLAIPGPVLGMAILLAILIARPPVAAAIRPTSQAILGNLLLLFVPAGVGVTGQLGLLAREGLAIGAATVVSTVAAMAVGAATFSFLARRMGVGEEPQ